MKIKRKLTPWLYSMPALILIGMVIVFPIIYTGYISLTNMNLFHWSNYEFIGLSNYSRALLKADSGFLGALFTTLLWTALNMVIQVVVAYFIALGFQGKTCIQDPFDVSVGNACICVHSFVESRHL